MMFMKDAAENTRMNDCYFEKKDWRLCKEEVRNFDLATVSHVQPVASIERIYRN